MFPFSWLLLDLFPVDLQYYQRPFIVETDNFDNLFIYLFILKIGFWAFVPLLYRTAEEWTGNRGDRGGMTCSKGPQVELNPGPLREDIASVYRAFALPTEPPGAPTLIILNSKGYNDKDGTYLTSLVQQPIACFVYS